MSSIRAQIRQSGAMTLVDRKVSRRLLLGVLILILALAATSAMLGQGTAAAAQTAGALRVMGGCELIECNAQAANGNAWSPAIKFQSDVLPIPPAQAGGVGAAAQEDEIDSPEVMVWSAMMTVGKSDIASIGYVGFVTGDWPDTGSIDDIAFTHGGVHYIVTALYHPIVNGSPNHLFLHLDMPLPAELSLRVGPDTFAVSEAEILGMRHNIYHWYLDSRLDWAEGDEIPVALMGWTESGTLEESLVRNVPPVIG